MSCHGSHTQLHAVGRDSDGPVPESHPRSERVCDRHPRQHCRQILVPLCKKLIATSAAWQALSLLYPADVGQFMSRKHITPGSLPVCLRFQTSVFFSLPAFTHPLDNTVKEQRKHFHSGPVSSTLLFLEISFTSAKGAKGQLSHH